MFFQITLLRIRPISVNKDTFQNIKDHEECKDSQNQIVIPETAVTLAGLLVGEC